MWKTLFIKHIDNIEYVWYNGYNIIKQGKVKIMEYKISLTKEELDNITSALTYYSVKYLYDKTKKSEYFTELWEKNLDLSIKLFKLGRK